MIKLYDVTLRDGNHALRHSLKKRFVSDYCAVAESSGVWAVEVGHGNGLGASSHLVGKSQERDFDLLETARNQLKRVKLGVHAIPGFATIKRDLVPALSIGVDVFRIATHVTEASLAQTHIEFLATHDVTVHGVLMMSHMIDIKGLINQAKLMKSYGASAIILMDSAGFFLPDDVKSRVYGMLGEVGIETGFHAHNNLGVAITNASCAMDNGATIIDGASMGLGAGAGNAQLENIVTNGIRKNIISTELNEFLKMSELVESHFMKYLPKVSASSILSGISGVFSGYAPHVRAISEEFGIDQSTIWKEMAKRKLVAGQESMIREIASDLMNL